MNWIELIEKAGEVALKLESQGGEDPDDLLSEFVDACDSKIEAYYAVIERLKTNSDLLKKEERRIKVRRQSLDAQILRLKQNAVGLLRASEVVSGEARVNTGRITAWVRSTPSVEIDEGVTLSPEFMREEVKISVDKIALKSALKSGEEIDGARLRYSDSIQFSNGAT